ncbi:hypothetical protein QTN47_01005 [Danxiaibacter flavus]|uniref:Uncharacterized protein n=1 Tax=Danxiaibacter flavus TaxID=3049108 RepID=A0ABV3Z859_9BACT|nr:hypothetical protein QNM32_01005 [Chitinophagaceae bacterium DXS]
MKVKCLKNGLCFFIVASFLPFLLQAQVNTVEFGKNRIQHKKFVWKNYQSPNFNVYFNQNGLELGKYVAQVAEEELQGLEDAVEYSLQRRANIVVYNTYDDYKSSNIGIGIDWQNAGGLTKLVNNKMVMYFNGDHNVLRRQIREGIARILTDNILFGDDVGEFASNQALLDLPKWLTDGYVEYIAEQWNPQKDDDLKSAILSGNYNTFYQFAFDKPTLAGHSFWYYIAERYKPENVTYFLYLARLYKNLNTAALKICKKKFKEVLEEFMQYEQDKYLKDIKQRRNAPRGRLTVVEETTKADYYRFAANPNAKNNAYAVVEFKKGVYSVKLVDNFSESKTLLKYGVRTYSGNINPNYPIVAWDVKGSRLLVIYWRDGKINMFVYDVIANLKRFKQVIEGVDQIVDASFMLDANTLLMSAVKNGHTDIYTYKIDNNKFKQITNDVYDDLDPSIVSFPNRTGIIFSSNRPGPNAPKGDTVLPSRNRYNVFLVDINNNSELKQITQLTNVKLGNARYPTQYNTNHFTFVSDENGIGNRWAGFFSTKRDGLDTLYYIGDEILRNPDEKELDSTLKAWQKPEPDSLSYFQVYKDSTYTFPITNYQSSLLESRVAGNNGQVTEVRREGDYKFLYKLRVDSVTLRKRNVNARPTVYAKRLLDQQKAASGKAIQVRPGGDTSNPAKPFDNIFQNEFEEEHKNDSAIAHPDTSAAQQNNAFFVPQLKPAPTTLEKSQLFNYRLKFSADYLVAGITNNILVNRFQPYTYGYGPIQLNNANDINFTFRVGVSDLFEDIKFIGGFRFGTTISDKDFFISFQNLRKRIDWGLTYYRSNVRNYPLFFGPGSLKSDYSNMVYTNLYQVNLAMPLNEVKSIRLQAGVRTDKGVVRPYFAGVVPDSLGLTLGDSTATTFVSHIEYVHDNTLNPAQNIWNGLRWKVYADYYFPLSKGSSLKGKNTLNVGFDARHYLKIYRNFIWAVRGAGDFSYGDAKILYYLGGVDGWVGPKFYNDNRPAPDAQYAFQSLTLNMRGFKQNIANGNNAVVINSEFRLPIFTTFFNKPVNNAFLRNFQVVQFFDLGTAWNGSPKNIERPTMVLPGEGSSNPVVLRLKAGGVGPFAGGYGFGVRSTLLGYFLKLDTAWPMNGFFRGKPMWYFALGLDF